MSEDAGRVDYVAGRVALKKFFEACLPLALTGNPSAHSLVMSPPLWGRHIVFALSVCPSIRLAVCPSVRLSHFVSAQ